MYKLKCAIQNYSWGHYGEESEVYKLQLANGETNLSIKLPYAELWLGTHVSGPSTLEINKKKLLDHIIENPLILGTSSIQKYGIKLPFLLKVLAVRSTLSIQIHPNKKQAEFLFRIAPEIYRDDNHKPELAIALGHMEALVAFRNLDEITFFIHSIPQLGNLIGEVKKGYLKLTNEEHKYAAFKVCFKTFMKSNPADIQIAVSSLVHDFQLGKINEYVTEKYSHLANIFLLLNSQYPNDIGCFFPFFLNYVVLEPGEAIYVPVNMPHAYLSGTMIECMASSDNILRAGLTQKPKDMETLVSMINYASYTVEMLKLPPVQLDSSHVAISRDLFAPPINDFAIERITVDVMVNFYALGDMYETASLIIVISGSGLLIAGLDGKILNQLSYDRGSTIFVSARVQVSVKASKLTTLFRAFTNIDS